MQLTVTPHPDLCHRFPSKSEALLEAHRFAIPRSLAYRAQPDFGRSGEPAFVAKIWPIGRHHAAAGNGYLRLSLGRGRARR